MPNHTLNFDMTITLPSGHPRSLDCPSCGTHWNEENWPEWEMFPKNPERVPEPPRCPHCRRSILFVITLPNDKLAWPDVAKSKTPRCNRWFDGDPEVGVQPEVENFADAEACCRMLEGEISGLTALRPIATVPRDGTSILLFCRGCIPSVGRFEPGSTIVPILFPGVKATHWLPLPVDSNGQYRMTYGQ